MARHPRPVVPWPRPLSPLAPSVALALALALVQALVPVQVPVPGQGQEQGQVLALEPVPQPPAHASTRGPRRSVAAACRWSTP